MAENSGSASAAIKPVENSEDVAYRTKPDQLPADSSAGKCAGV